VSAFTPEKQAQAKAFGLTVAEKVREYFKSAEHRREFEIWYERRYGKKYQWKKVKV